MNSTKRIVRVGILSALLVVAQVALAFIPNVELVTVLLMSYTIVFGTVEAIIISLVFVTVEWLLWGVHTWVILYYFIWPLLVIMTSYLYKRTDNITLLALLGVIFGLLFGITDALISGLFYGAGAIVTVWVRGLIFDLVHAFSNFLTITILLEPLNLVLNKYRINT